MERFSDPFLCRCAPGAGAGVVVLSPSLHVYHPQEFAQMLLFCPNQLTGCGALSPASAPRLRVAGQVLFTLLLLPFPQPPELCLGPYIPFHWSGTLPGLSWCSVRTAAFVDVFLMHPCGERLL